VAPPAAEAAEKPPDYAALEPVLEEKGCLENRDIREVLGVSQYRANRVAQRLIATGWLYPILATMAFTGVRRGEAVALEWGEVDFEGGRIWVRSRKQSRKQEFTARDIGLHDKLRDVLLRHREHGPKGRYVFRGRDGGPLTPYELHEAFKKLIRGSDYEGIGLHCLRHSFASNLAAQGVDGRLIDHYMGHQTEAMRHRYQHLFPEKKSEGIQRLPY